LATVAAVPQRSRACASIGRKVTQLRDARGLSQEQLSLNTGIHRGTLSELEQGKSNPSLEILVVVSGELDVPLSELVSEVQVPEPELVRARLKKAPE
jgi:transcriptional regulator with XRE-family HTH domain